MKPTGDADQDRRQQDELNKELARLQRNKDRRLAREKMKKRHASQIPEAGESAGSPSGDQPKASVEKTGTTRKCANCGQAGHIKTNKKYYCSASCVPPKKKPGRKPGPKKSRDELDTGFQPRYTSRNKASSQHQPKTILGAAVENEEAYEHEAAPLSEGQGGEESEEE